MLDEFRALGGTAENICVKEGRFGRGLFPIDSSVPIAVHVPESLLVPLKYLEWDGDAVRIGADAATGPREKAFFESYQRDFSWGVARHETAELLRMLHEAPPQLRELLKGSPWLSDPTPEATRERFFAARGIVYQGKPVIVPIVELANHGHLTAYRKQGGVGLSGKFDGEILVRYRAYDPLQMFNHWGFASPEPFALSLPAHLQTKSGLLQIRLEPQNIQASAQNPFLPKVTVEKGRMTLSFLMLGHKSYPRLARGIFYRIMRDAGWAVPEEAFDGVQHLNRIALYKIIDACEAAAPELGKLVRKVALYQLETMSHSVGARDV